MESKTFDKKEGKIKEEKKNKVHCYECKEFGHMKYMSVQRRKGRGKKTCERKVSAEVSIIPMMKTEIEEALREFCLMAIEEVEDEEKDEFQQAFEDL